MAANLNLTGVCARGWRFFFGEALQKRGNSRKNLAKYGKKWPGQEG